MDEQLIDAPPPRSFFDEIPTDASERIDQMFVYPTTFVPSFDLAAKFPQLVPKVAVLLHPRRVSAPISVQVSKIGGHIYWPRDEPWQTCSEHPDSPLIAVMQLNRRDFPSMKFPEGKNLFQMLWCPTVDHDHESSGIAMKPVFLWRTMKKEEQLLLANQVPTVNQATLEDTYVPRRMCVVPRACQGVPGLARAGPYSWRMREIGREITDYLEEQSANDLLGPEMMQSFNQDEERWSWAPKPTNTEYMEWGPMSYGSKLGGYPTQCP